MPEAQASTQECPWGDAPILASMLAVSRTIMKKHRCERMTYPAFKLAVLNALDSGASGLTDEPSVMAALDGLEVATARRARLPADFAFLVEA